MTLNLSSGITAREEPPKTRMIQDVATAILLGLGVTERGPHEVTKIVSFEEYLDVFGSDTLNSDLCPAMRAFFDEGGTEAYIKRVVHYTDIESAGTRQGAKGTITLQSAAGAPGAGYIVGTIAGTWAFVDGDTLIVNVDAGGDATATFNVTAALIECANAETYALSDGLTLTFKIDDGAVQTVTFNTAEFVAIGAATAEEVAAVINGEAYGCSATVTSGGTKVTITSDKLGTGSKVEVTGGTANSALGFSTSPVSGTGDAADSLAVTAAELKTLIEGDISGCTVSEATGGYLQITSNTTGASSSIQVNATSTMDDELGLDNALHSGDSGAAADALEVEGKTDGSYTDTIKIRILDATSGETERFNLQVEDDGVVVEGPFPNLTMDTTDDRFAETIINGTNGSNLITVDEPTPALQKRPVNGLSAFMTGGDDGLTSLAATDFIGSATTESGLRGFDTVEDGTLLIVPGRTSAALQVAMLTYCEDTRDGEIFAILDPPLNKTASQMVTQVETTNALLDRSEYGCIFWPPVKVLNPATAVYGSDDEITVYPSGHIAGLFARGDAAIPGGVYRAAAGIGDGRGLFRTVTGLESDETKDKRKRDLLYPKRINPISFVNKKITADGVRTLRGNSNFPTIPERRGVIAIKRALRIGLEFARFDNNDRTLRAEVARAIIAYLIAQMRRGAFRSTNPSEAFTVDVSDALNPPSVVFAGQLIAKVGLATQKPAEFINLIFSQDTRALDAELAVAAAS